MPPHGVRGRRRAARECSRAASPAGEDAVALARLRSVDAEYGVRGLDLDLWRGRVALVVGPSGAGKSSLLGLLAAGQPVAADEFDMSSLDRPLPILDGPALAAPPPELAPADVEPFGAGWRQALRPAGRSARWKAHACGALQRQGHGRRGGGLLLLDEALDSMPRPLRGPFAADLRAAARHAGFAALSATHCLAGDVGWMQDAADDVLILEEGRLRRTLRLEVPRDLQALREYAALRSRLGTVNP